MQARKLNLVEAHPSQVAKVEVDAASQCVALLLRDSSCFLSPSISGTSSPLLIPSCTDICFLRLRQRSTQLPSSSSSDKSAEPISRSEPRTLANVEGKPSMAAAEGIRDALPMVASVGNGAPGSTIETLLFLALKPAKGGICTDMMAWRCSEVGFSRTRIILEGSVESFNRSLVTRLDDIPHGISADITASINVVVVHSPTIGKLWIFSAKYSKAEQSCAKFEGVESGHIPMKDLVLNPSKDDSKCDGEKHEKENYSCLHLFKCAVVDCNGPVYSMHLSLQHLLVGQLGGVRVWLLRPLIKGSTVVKKDLKAAHHYGRGGCTSVKQEGIKTSEDQESGRKITETYGGRDDQHSDTVYGSGSVRTVEGFCPVLAAPKNGLYELSVVQCDGTKIACSNGLNSTEGNCFSKKQSCSCSGKPLEGVLFSSNGGGSMQITSYDAQQDAASNAPKLVQFEVAPVPAHRNGTYLEFYPPEELKSQQKLSQFSTLSSSSDSSSSLLPPHSACVRSSSCQSLTSSLSSVAGARTTSAFHKAEFEKASQAGVFVPLQRNSTLLSSPSLAKVEQVTGIHGLSEKDFVVVDSNGKLHSLTLQYLTRKDETRVSRTPRVSLNASLQPLMCGMKIKYLTVLPDLHSGIKNSGSASRVLWVSDGCYTVYIVTVPAREPFRGGSGKIHLAPKSSLTVIGTVFLMERARSLFAFHENVVMVLTEGSMLAYSSTGT